MTIIKEWKCAQHGSFEGTHPLCPAMGCFSEHVEREFRTPVSVSKGKYARFDRGLRDTADRMNISDFKTAREGETAFAGRAPIGQELLWGNDIQRVMGRPLAEQINSAHTPLVAPANVAANDPYLTINSGMRAAANTIGITARKTPQAEFTAHRNDVPAQGPAA